MSTYATDMRTQLHARVGTGKAATCDDAQAALDDLHAAYVTTIPADIALFGATALSHYANPITVDDPPKPNPQAQRRLRIAALQAEKNAYIAAISHDRNHAHPTPTPANRPVTTASVYQKAYSCVNQFGRSSRYTSQASLSHSLLTFDPFLLLWYISQHIAASLNLGVRVVIPVKQRCATRF
jgi:hypothetical protein